ncbi:GGDEF domain-containing protein [Eggerthella sp. YY7918]|uniref:GGDEF domain-containing protein n=1 Tax=Eggerthella sp. (strain YY7918) TaxID=502558 RepID=UPI0002170F07|nr:GGDEF domain-containing protein [Eggerthella sp. YY7918]BAK43689.1 hypothetical protein EGYY_04760 [Eggerthella sp. YY7918]
MERTNGDIKDAGLSPAAQVEHLMRTNAALKAELATMRGLAFRDQLTGLYSRRYLTDFLVHEIIEASESGTVVLALCDIDDFKSINDLRGHRSGDIAIACIADILEDLAGGQPVIRWGGEELLITLFAFSDLEALRLCNDIRRQIEAYSINDGLGEYSCTVTFGIGTYDPKLTFEGNFLSIDRALYEGKETGKNRCILVRNDASKESLL